MLQQVKKLREGEQENKDTQNEVDKLDCKEELLHLRRHNQDFLIQVKKLEHDKKSI